MKDPTKEKQKTPFKTELNRGVNYELTRRVLVTGEWNVPLQFQ
jgi:hypothetical protein